MIQAVHFEADGRSWSLRFGFAGLSRIEETFGIPVAELARVLQPEGTAPRLMDLARIVHCGLEQRDATPEDVVAMFDALGADGMVALVARALQAAFPQAESAGTPGGKKRGAAR